MATPAQDKVVEYVRENPGRTTRRIVDDCFSRNGVPPIAKNHYPVLARAGILGKIRRAPHPKGRDHGLVWVPAEFAEARLIIPCIQEIRSATSFTLNESVRIMKHIQPHRFADSERIEML